MRLTAILTTAFLLLVITVSSANETEELEDGRNYTRLFFDNDISPIWNNMTDQMQSALKTESALQDFRKQVQDQIGSEKTLVDERVEEVQGHRVYIRRSLFAKLGRPVVISWTFDDKDRIAGFFIRPEQEPAESPYLGYMTQAELKLPFYGEWYVVWGGRDIEDNYHVVASDQRFAYDILIVKDDSSHTGDGSLNEQYFCWGEPVLAPGDGTIVAVVAGLPDNPPGVMDADNPPGNHVWLDMGNAEFASLAHLQRGSVAVSEGDVVEVGDVIGRCGNSGNTTEPHIHFHIQDQPGFGMGAGKPAFFRNYLSNGAGIMRGEPARGELVQNAPNADN